MTEETNSLHIGNSGCQVDMELKRICETAVSGGEIRLSTKLE